MAKPKTTDRPGRRWWTRPSTRGATVCLGLVLGATIAWAESDLIITSGDYPIEVGRKLTYASVSADGKWHGRVESAIVDRLTVGQVTLFREAWRIGAARQPDNRIVKTDKEIAYYSAGSTKTPFLRLAFPLRRGAASSYLSGEAKVRARVEGPVDVAVPAGKFRCVVCIEEREARGRRWGQRIWVARGVGMVKAIFHLDQDHTLSLTGFAGPRPAPSEPGAVVLSNFDTDDPLGSPLFPKAGWQGAAGSAVATSTCEIDPFHAAAGSAFSMRWAYHIKGTWANVHLLLSGSWTQPVDLSRYASLSFRVKGMAERACNFQLHSVPPGAAKSVYADVPVKVTPHWRRVAVDLRAAAQSKGIDLARVHMLDLADYDAGYASNVVWIDEVLLHPAEPPRP